MRYGHFTLLPERAFLKVGGKIMPQGGGSGGSSAPSSQTITNTSIPEYARPYAESMLGQTSALTNINDNPYQPYQGQQVAGFSPLQNQGFTSLADMQIAPQLAMGTDIANQASQGAMSTAPTAMGYGSQGSQAGQAGQGIGVSGGLGYGAQGYGIGQQGMQAGMSYGQNAQDPGAVQGYMNPYLQAALQPQLTEMQRQYGISGAQGQSNATRAGAFGGSREALMFAENQRNKNIAMNQAIGQGYNTAYDVANRNMQAASSLGMQGAGIGLQGVNAGLQGVNTALAGTAQGMQGAQTGLAGVQGAQNAYGIGIQGANTLGSLGTAQYNQQMGIAQAQLAAGAQQQQLAQQQLNVPYQQYQDQMNYPYKQLAFQSDMMRGLPLSQSAQTVYQNTGAMAPQLLGAGIAAYGASAGRGAKEGGLMSYARGGAVQGYAMGGQPTVDPRAVAATSPAALPSKLAQLSDGQLQAYARTVKDAVALAEVKAEMARRASVRQPQGEEPTQTVAQEIAGQGGITEQPMMAAGGGIVALNKGGDGKDDPNAGEAEARTAQAAKERGGAPTSFFGIDLTGPAPAEVPFEKRLLPRAWNAFTNSFTSTRPSNIPPRVDDAGIARVMAQENALPQTIGGQPQQAPQTVDMANARVMAQENALPQVPAVVPTSPSYAENEAEGTGRHPNLGGITSVARNTSGAAPAGGIDAITPRTPGAGGFNAVPTAPGAAGSGDIFGWGTYAANVAKAAELDPEDKAVLADLQKRTERKLQRAEKQERGVMSEALISGGLAMMGGVNLSDGIRRLAEAGGKQYFSSQAEARKAIEKADEAQDAFSQYKLSLKQGNKKLAAEMYGKYYGTVMEFQGKIQSAGITAGASMANAKAQQEANVIRQAEVTRAHQASEQLRADTLKATSDQARERLAATEYANNTQRQNAIRTYVQSDPAVVSLKEAGKNWANLPDSPEYKKNQALLQAAQRDALEEFHRIETQVAARGKGASTPPPPPGFQIPK